MAKLKKLQTNLTIQGEEVYNCSTSKNYTDSFTIEQELDNSTAFITLSSFSKSIASLTIANAKACVIKNISDIAAEVCIATYDWKDSSSVDATNSVDVGGGGATRLRTWTQILPAGDFLYLNTNRIVSYASTDNPGSDGFVYQSAADAGVGVIGIEPKDINSANEYRKAAAISGTTYGSGSDVLVDGTVSDLTQTSFVADDGSYFKAGDLLILGNTPDEVVEVVSVSGTTVNIKRGLLGTSPSAITNNEEINYFFGNEYLPYNTGRCQSDADGRFKQKGAFFGYARTADAIADGLVPGSVAIGPFYTEGGELDFGLSGVVPSGETGLASSTTYTFHIVVDEFHANGFDSVSSETAIAFTTDASDTTWAGSGNAVLPKIQAVFDQQFYTTGSGLRNKRVTIGIVNGDIRVTSHSNHSETIVGIGNVSGTTPFDVGNFPALSSGVPVLLGSQYGGGTTDTIVYGPKSTLAPATIDDKATGKSETNTSTFIFDDGNGNLLHQGRNVGWVEYETGHCEWQVKKFANAEFKVYANSHSAHSGGVANIVNGYNSIESIRARSVNQIENSKLKMVLYG